ncbi:hypothetical protein KBC97_03795 [Candidatus Gracilibacteria bacterium]|nr:hypothetical protein [Candidatus Gracilibacteria bacterium]
MKNIVQLSLDSYQDLFSDFDPRAYSERGLSDDFLHELKSAVREISVENFEIILSLPEKERNLELEKIITERLHDYFRKHEQFLLKERREQIKSGILMTSFGLIIMCGAWFLSWQESNKIMSLLRVMLEPAGWFMSWEGLAKIFFLSNSNRHLVDFYKKSIKAKIVFVNV